jgi:superfamily II DNA/RNA helicase
VRWFRDRMPIGRSVCLPVRTTPLITNQNRIRRDVVPASGFVHHDDDSERSISTAGGATMAALPRRKLILIALYCLSNQMLRTQCFKVLSAAGSRGAAGCRRPAARPTTCTFRPFQWQSTSPTKTTTVSTALLGGRTDCDNTSSARRQSIRTQAASSGLLTVRQFATQEHQESVDRAPSASVPASLPTSFEEMGLHPVLVERLHGMGMTAPTSVQASAFQKFLEGSDLTIGSETGSGKTLAYLLPIMHDILTKRDQLQESQRGQRPYEYARAVILVPNKELVQQVVRMAAPLAGGSKAIVSSSSTDASSEDDTAADHLIRVAVLPGGLNDPDDFRPFRDAANGKVPPPDLIVSTPAVLAPWGIKPKCIGFFADLPTLVVDEADMCVDGGYVRAVEQVLLGFKRADRLLSKYREDTNNNESQPTISDDPTISEASSAAGIGAKRKTQHAFVAATIPDYGLRSVSAWLSRRFPRMERIEMDDLHMARHSGLTETTAWIPIETKKDRMLHLVDLLQTEYANDKTMIFCNSVDDVDSVAQALQRAGFANAVPYHAKLSLQDRTQNLEKFRSYRPPSEAVASTSEVSGTGTDAVLMVCTDLASRGLDVPGVTAVVQLQFAGNAVAHLHRMGRCGRASTQTGRGVVYYGAQESDLVRVLMDAESQQEQSSLQLAGEVKDESAWSDEDEGDIDAVESPSSIAGEDEGRVEDGTIRNAFSRKRGFTKKRKKLRSSNVD